MENIVLGQALLPTCLKTLIFPVKATNEAFLNTLVSRFKHLRCLVLGSSEYESLPRCIGKLKHLRYLSLQDNEKLKELPDSVCELQILQIFLFDGCLKQQELPKGIRKLISLRHLHLTIMQPDLPAKEIANLTSLEDLRFVDCDKLESLSEGIQLPSLKTLTFICCGRLKSLSFVIRNLENLVIEECGKLELSIGLGNQIPKSSLKYLGLKCLPQLITLPQWLQGSANTLHSLIISSCKNLEELVEWLSTLICLKVLQITDCPKLFLLPENMHHLTNLELLYIDGCPELCKRCQGGVGQE